LKHIILLKWCRKEKILCRKRRIHFGKKSGAKVFTAGVENEQKSGADNWWTTGSTP
jgi:hypothetical protein